MVMDRHPSNPQSGEEQVNIQERIDFYRAASGFPSSLFVGEDGRLSGVWVMGNNYKVASSYYGGYPHGYLKRVKCLFPDKATVLHLFSGQVDQTYFSGDTVDINPDNGATFVDDAQSLDSVPLEKYDMVLADPPYSVEDCDHYQTSMIKRNKVMKALSRLSSGAHIVWLDQVLPMYRKDTFRVIGYIGMVKSTNHRFRVITIFERI